MKRISLRAQWRRFKAAPRLRIMTWALLASVLCGVTGFLDPLDDFARALRYTTRYISADRSIVVVGIDQKSIQELGGKFPWSYSKDAQLIENLKRAGAKRIVFDRAFADLDSPESDEKLIDVLKRYKGDIYFGSGVLNSKYGRNVSAIEPASKFRAHVRVASFVTRNNTLGQTGRVYWETPFGELHDPSISSVLANIAPTGSLDYRPDFSIRNETFPIVSFSDVVLGRVGSDQVRGKDILIGATEVALGDTHVIPAQGPTPGLFAHAIGAQTLKSGMPVDVGFALPLLCAALASILILRTKRGWVTALYTLTFLVLVTCGPIGLDHRLISVDIAPAVLLFGIVALQQARLRLGWKKSRTHESSGLANIAALRELAAPKGASLIIARIDNHAAIMASFAKDVENLIVQEIVRRLNVGDSATEVYQGDEGIYAWMAPFDDRTVLADHLDGLHALLAQPIQVGDRQIDAVVTFGVDDNAARPMSSRIGSALLSAEDARRQGLRWKFYDAARSADAAWQLSLGGEIDRGLNAGEFWLAYQPKLDLRTGHIIGAEVLLRWAHPERGAIGPAEFIPAAERDHRIERLTQFVFRQAMADAKTMSGVGRATLALNVSVPVLRRPDFAGYAIGLADEFGLPASTFTVEITESVFLSASDDVVLANLKALGKAGFGVSIDDFGTGFSTLESLQRVPATEVKIDQTFVKSLSSAHGDRIIVSSIIKMAKGLDRKVVAEGVEDVHTLRQLAALGCDEVQGYFIGRPQPFADFVALLAKTEDRTAA